MEERSRRSRRKSLPFWPLTILLGAILAPAAHGQSMAMAAKGQKIFFKVCVQCHTLQEKSQPSGPGLAGVMERVPSEAWLMEWLRDPEAMVKDGDSYAKDIADDYSLDMPKLPVMQKELNRKAVITFLKQIREEPME